LGLVLRLKNKYENLMAELQFDDDLLIVVAGFPASLDDPLIPIVKGGPHPRQQTLMITDPGGDKPRPYCVLVWLRIAIN